MVTPVGFWSYARHDDAHSDGHLSQLRVIVGKAIGLRYGGEVTLWQDIAAIPFGADWAQTIARTIGQTTFFIPIVTPRFLKSANCHEEYAAFRERMQALGRNDLVFPIHYVDVDRLRPEDSEFGDLATLRSHQWIDFRPYLDIDPRSPEVRGWAGTFAKGILQTMWQLAEDERRAAEQRTGEEADRRVAEATVRKEAERCDAEATARDPQREAARTPRPAVEATARDEITSRPIGTEERPRTLLADQEPKPPLASRPTGSPKTRRWLLGAAGGAAVAGTAVYLKIAADRSAEQEEHDAQSGQPTPLRRPMRFTATGPTRTFSGHTDRVTSVAILPDGKTALSGSADRTLKLWDLASGRDLRTFTGDTGLVRCVAIVPDGRTAMSGSSDSTLELWDLANGRSLRSFTGHAGAVSSVAVAPDGKTALSGSFDYTLKLWDLATGRELRRFDGHLSQVTSVAIAPDGRTAMSGSWDQTPRAYASGAAPAVLKLWEIETGREIRTFVGHTKDVRAVAIARDGRTALSGSADHTLKLWDLASGRELRTLTGHTLAVNSVAVSPDGKTALSGSDDKTLKLWDLADGRNLRSFDGHTLAVNSVAVSPDGKTGLSGSDDKTLKLWDLT